MEKKLCAGVEEVAARVDKDFELCQTKVEDLVGLVQRFCFASGQFPCKRLPVEPVLRLAETLKYTTDSKEMYEKLYMPILNHGELKDIPDPREREVTFYITPIAYHKEEDKERAFDAAK